MIIAVGIWCVALLGLSGALLYLLYGAQDAAQESRIAHEGVLDQNRRLTVATEALSGQLEGPVRAPKYVYATADEAWGLRSPHLLFCPRVNWDREIDAWEHVAGAGEHLQNWTACHTPNRWRWERREQGL